MRRSVSPVTEDPVCETPLDDMLSALEWMGLTTSYKGETYHFCSVKCKSLFEKDPDRYRK